jgi:hypothetical protein
MMTKLETGTKGIFVQDDDSHWYFIQSGEVDSFHNLLERLQAWQEDPVDSALADNLFHDKFSECRINYPSEYEVEIVSGP